MTTGKAILAAALLLAGGMASAQPASRTINVAASPFTAAERSVPRQLNAAERGQYAAIFRDIDAGRLTAAEKALSAMPRRGVLHPVAEARILLGRGSKAGLTRLLSWLKDNPAAPDARAIAQLAHKAGGDSLPPLAATRQLLPVRLTPALNPRSARAENAIDAEFAAKARTAVSAERPLDVEAMLDAQGAQLSADIRSEWAERAAWMAYISLDDTTAFRLARRAVSGTSEWAAMGHWVAALASFRQGDCEAAARHFDSIGEIYTASPDLRAAGAYWAARSQVRCGRPWQSTERLRAAVSRAPDSFYGLLAAEALGIESGLDWREPDFIQADWSTLSSHPGARRAAALVEIGELGLADRELRQLAVATSNDSYEPILRLAARLDLPATQYWLAQNPPPGQMPPMSARFPNPNWTPLKGWRIDRSLVFAHALQESKFITDARSGAGAKGVMQLMPGTARDVARTLDIQHRDALLGDPAYNIEYGQSYLEMLRDSPHTNGLLPKIMAAYNAGPGAVMKWNAGALRDNGDVLLFMESIPFLETRHYVEVVMRNYWLYQMKEQAQDPLAGDSNSITAMAANRWPTLAPGGN